ncbi:MAG: nucleotide exchange factor GrpE [Bacteroidia bacterium]
MKEEMKDHEVENNQSQTETQTTENPVIENEIMTDESIPTPEDNEDLDSHESDNQQLDESFATIDDAIKVIAELQMKLRSAHKEAEDQKDKVLRLQADFDNFRKRKAKEQTDTVRFANQELLLNLLPVLDNFSRTLDAIEKTDNLTAIKEGIGLVDNSMRLQLSKIGLEPIECVGKPFDSEIHEAISSFEVEDESRKGLIIDEVEKGYRYRDKVIRFSKVIVGE